ncbi:ferritin-like domain-containing protein [Sphingomonas sp. MA1305]|uniref:ferritin-like domain-containing protein n=1 Tax=Sphingomonas sp. MA1305 TaxID=2479204 RepID=UPI0018E02072|nr:ferritin-like domain-containing protein [Sphingomonas sp. MA1305]MBI0476434.1 ferritin-like domain-containing protein [Sphingomonas sp. MA1305]
MTQSEQLVEALDARVTRRNERRELFRMVLGAAAVGGAFAYADAASAQTAPSDADVLNFALNLEYLEANFYSFAAFGTAINSSLTSGTGTLGSATGGRAVAFQDPLVAQYAKEIAQDEIAHVAFLRSALGSAAVAQPAIDVGTSATGAFSSAARAAGLVGTNQSFDPYASDNNFLLASFIFEDVGVTAYKGASPLISNKTFLEAAAGILAAEAYHAAIVRTVLYQKGIATPSLRTSADAISNARDSLDGSSDDDQGISPVTISSGTASNIVPVDSNGLAYSRSTGAVLNIVYLTKAAVTMGGFFPAGVNGSIRTSTAQA